MILDKIFYFISTQADTVILPDSVQKANFNEKVQQLMNLDVDKLLEKMLNEAIWISLKIVLALAIYIVGRWILRRIIHVVDIILSRRNIDTSLQAFTLSTIKIIFTLILLLIVVQTLGVNVTSLIAMFSAATLAIGMALSGTAQNFAGGVMILLLKPYRVGDFISAQGQSGVVKEIKLFSTVVTTGDNQTIFIPNNSIATAIINNFTTAKNRRVDLEIGISYGDDVEVARKVILDMMKTDNRILKDPEAIVKVKELGASSVNLVVRAWVKNANYWDVLFDYNEKIYNELPKHGINFPFPQLDVHLTQK